MELQNFSEDKKQKKSKPSKVSDWMVAIGIGVTIAAVTAGTVYVVKKRRQAELRALKFGEEEIATSATFVNTASATISKYWNMSVRAFGFVKKLASSLTAKPNAPFVPPGTPSKYQDTNTTDAECEAEL